MGFEYYYFFQILFKNSDSIQINSVDSPAVLLHKEAAGLVEDIYVVQPIVAAVRAVP